MKKPTSVYCHRLAGMESVCQREVEFTHASVKKAGMGLTVLCIIHVLGRLV